MRLFKAKLPNDNPEQKIIERRTIQRGNAFMGIFIALAIFCVIVLFTYQILGYEGYQERVLDGITSDTKVNPSRGVITDINGNVLATNVSVYEVSISPQDIIDASTEKEDEDEDKDKDEDESEKSKITLYDYVDPMGRQHTGEKMNDMIATVLSQLLGVDREFVLKQAAKKGRRWELIAKGVEEDVADEIRKFIDEQQLKHHEINLAASPKRYYPYKDLAAHVIGFTNTDGTGIYGVEAYYDKLLAGTAGRYITAEDAHNNDMPFTYESFIEAENGYNIETTIDVYIQSELENQLKQTFLDNGSGERVCGIVMDVNTGAIKAMGVYPSFDLNDPFKLDDYFSGELEGLPVGCKKYNEKHSELLYKMWTNKNITETYEPGSTFKPITGTMGFEDNVLHENDGFYCGGSYNVEGYGPISCHDHNGHGAVTFTVGLQQSCNPTLMQAAQRIGKERFYDYFRAFGYTERTGIDLPGEVYPIYTPEKDFTGVSLAVYSFGQTFKVSPIQQITALAAIANGGDLLTPHVLSRVLDDDGNVIYEYETNVRRSVASKDSCDRITKILEEGVSGDGGAKNCYVRGYKVAGKTGTSEKKDKYDKETNSYPYRVGSAMGFAPAYDPEIIALIIDDEPTNGVVYGSQVAAPYISRLLAYALPYLGYEPQYSESELASVETTVGQCVGADRATATAYLDSLGLSYETVGEGDVVTSQLPEAGTSVIKSNAKVILYFGDDSATSSVTVPNLIGSTAENATQTLTYYGLNVSFTGTQSAGALVTSQSIPEGTVVPPGTVIVLSVAHTDGTD